MPFGEAPLAQARIARVQSILERLQAQGFHGTVQIRSFPGRFCLASADGAALAAAESGYAQCAALASPLSTAAAGERESPAFAGMIAAARQHAGSGFSVQLNEGTAEETVADYPSVTEHADGRGVESHRRDQQPRRSALARRRARAEHYP